MNKNRSIYFTLFFLSASVLCFEIISTRITSVIFVNDYAFIILSLAILGLGSGGIYSYYRIRSKDGSGLLKLISKTLFLFGISFISFIIGVIAFTITDPYIFLFLLFIPFFLAGIAYAQIFKNFAENSFKIYAADLSGAATGSLASLGLFSLLGASNSILLLALIIFSAALSLVHTVLNKKARAGIVSILLLSLVVLIQNGKNEFLGMIPIGNFPEKDFYHVYSDPTIHSSIVDSRWSIYGRSDLVEYSHQNIVKQLFIGGAAGTQMYRFNGNIKKPDLILLDLLVRHSSSIPFLILKAQEKNNMLIIGPGGGKEVLIGLFGGVEHIKGIEINPDFVDIVEDQKNFNGGIYTDFPNVDISVQEGRQYVKQTTQNYDIILMALPSTEQIQNIEAFAMSENYLITREAIQDYLKLLTPEGCLIFTVHNTWELMRLITTAMFSFEQLGINNRDAINHFAVLESGYSPTLLVKNNAFSKDDIAHWQSKMKQIPQELPAVTFLPDSWDKIRRTEINRFLMSVSKNDGSLQKYIDQNNYNITPCLDDSPYFYKIGKGIPSEYLWLLLGTIIFNFIIILFPFRLLWKKIKNSDYGTIIAPLSVLICIGIGFMVLEVSLFQKLVLYLGSPATSLSILLSSLLTGMGIGSYWGKKIYETEIVKRLMVICSLTVVIGLLLFILSPLILSKFLVFSLLIRCTLAFFLILPFGFVLGIPFPSSIQLLKKNNMEKYIPWMYGVNGAMSVLGSILAVILSMLFSFTTTFSIGLSFYLIIPILLRSTKKYI
jgi:spermidine synthase